MVQPQGGTSPYLSYKIFLLLMDSASLDDGPSGSKQDRGDGGEEEKDRVKSTLKLELESGTKTQFSEAEPLQRETLGTVLKELPQIIELCNRHRVQ